MKKTVLAIAVGAALATAGVAQAEVTIFGKAHLSFDMITAVDPEDATDTTSDMYVSSNSSQLGFKEEEDIGDGLKAGLFFDTQVTMDSKDTNGSTTSVCTVPTSATACTKTTVPTSSGIFDRQTYAYLSGGFGTVTIGKVEGLNKLLGRKIDLFGDQIGDSRNLITAGLNDTRPAGVLQYSSPKMGPISAQLLYKPNEASSTKKSSGTYTDGNTQIGLAAQYSEGPLFVGLSYETIGEGQHGHTFATPDDGVESSTNMRLGATFTMGDAMVAGLYSTVSNVGGADGVDNTVFGIGGSYKLGNGAVKGQYYMASNDCSGSACDDTGATMIAVGYDHNLSKKTKVYAAYAATSNEDAAAYSAVGAGHGSGQSTSAVTGESSSGLSFGIVHTM